MPGKPFFQYAIRLPVRYHISPDFIAETMKKPAQIIKSIQPAKANRFPIFPIYYMK